MSPGNNTSVIATAGRNAKGDPAHGTLHVTSEVWRWLVWCLQFLGSSWVVGCIEEGRGRKVTGFGERGWRALRCNCQLLIGVLNRTGHPFHDLPSSLAASLWGRCPWCWDALAGRAVEAHLPQLLLPRGCSTRSPCARVSGCKQNESCLHRAFPAALAACLVSKCTSCRDYELVRY